MERLGVASRDVATFEFRDLRALVARARPSDSADDHAATVQELCDRGVLQVLPRHGGRIRVHPDVLEFVQRLTRERDLGLSTVIKARIDSIVASTAKLVDATASLDRPGMVGAARQLWQQFDEIASQLDHDAHAIHEIAEEAKAMDAGLPLKVRYQRVLEAYDTYIQPMVEMMDFGPSGLFSQHLMTAADALEAAERTLSAIQGTIVSDTRAVRDAGAQARELRRVGRDVMNQSAQTLLPLRSEVRDHSSIAAAISAVLGLVRKRGAVRALPDAALPLTVRSQYHKLHAGPELAAIMAAALDYIPAPVPFPDEEAVASPLALDIVDLRHVRRDLKAAGEVPDLLEWLSKQYPEWQDATVLGVFHDLARGLPLDMAPDPHATTLKGLRVHHHALAVADAHTEAR